MNALQKTISQLRTLNNGQLADAEGIAVVRMTKAEFTVFAAALRVVRAERKAV